MTESGSRLPNPRKEPRITELHQDDNNMNSDSGFDNSSAPSSPIPTSSPVKNSESNTNLASLPQKRPRGNPNFRRKKPLISGDSSAPGTPRPSSPAPRGSGTPSSIGPARLLAQGPNGPLKSLDLSGAPCRRWVKKPINISSFTKYTFSINAWSGLLSAEEEEQRVKQEGVEKKKEKVTRQGKSKEKSKEKQKQDVKIAVKAES